MTKHSPEEIRALMAQYLKPIPDGIHRTHHPNGTLKSEGPILGGLRNGDFREWHDNGCLAKEARYRNGKRDGAVRCYSRDGRLLGEYHLSMGLGMERIWNEDGSLAIEQELLEGGLVRGVVYDDRGKAHEHFLINGKPTTKMKFMAKAAAQKKPQPPVTSVQS